MLAKRPEKSSSQGLLIETLEGFLVLIYTLKNKL